MTVVKNVIRVLAALVSLFMICWYFVSGMVNAGSICGTLFFLCCGLAAVAFDSLKSLYLKCRKKLWSRILCDAVIFAFCAVIVWSGIIVTAMTHYASRRPAKGATAVVLGCQVNGEDPSLMLLRRLEAACAYLNDNPDAKCVVSGGKGSNEMISEAECMYRWLVDHGIDSRRIYKEDRSSNTAENIAFSAEIIEKNRLDPELAVVTDGFHEMRALRLAEGKGFSCGAVPADTPFFLLGTFATREVIAVTAELILP